jgi:signal transduction histidine kinase
MVETKLDSWERRLERISAVIPYVVLAISLVLAWVTAAETPIRGSLVWTTAIAAATAGWMWVWVGLDPARLRPKPELAGWFFVGFSVFYAVLQYRASVFGFFAFAGYIYALQVMKGRGAFIGVAVTGLISGNAIYGGAPPTRWQDVPVYLVVLLVTVMFASVFSFIGNITTLQSQRRKEMVAELAALNAKLKEAMEENAGLHAQLLTQAREAGILDERQRMAREIHDTLAQSLTGIITQVQASEGASRAEDGQRHLDNAVRLARDALSEARRTVHAVRPEALETARLPEALAEVVERWSALNGVRAEVVTTGTARPLHPEVEVTLLRIAQEALANVAKHAGASRVGLTLSYMEDVVTLDVRDNGVGFDLALVDGRESSAAGGFGLHSMRQRVQRLTGSLAVESAPGDGTAISASVPAILPGGES